MVTYLAGETTGMLKKADTPFISDGKLPAARPDEKHPEGKLKSNASKVLMKVLYPARVARYDLLLRVNYFATRVSSWDVTCGKCFIVSFAT